MTKMADSDSQQNAEKSAFEAAKLSLETRLLQRQLSVSGLLMGWLQAASVPVALVGAILAFFVGFGQLRQGADNQAAERFDKALTRLASQRPDERMTGVSGLDLFLRDDNPLLQKQALQFLINGLSLETDVRVGGAILDVLADLAPGRPSQSALDEGLRTAVERDRSLTRSIVKDWPKRVVGQKKQTLAKFKMAGLDLNGMGDEIPAKVLAMLSVEQYLALLDAEHGPFENLDPSEDVPLIDLSTAIQTLIARGAISEDFKSIFCEKCNFSTAKSLDAAIFDGAYLAKANFAHASLRGASFRYADIAGTNFFGADLTKADLRAELYRPGIASKGFAYQLPLLECAKLGGADLSGQPLVFFVKTFDTTSSSELTYSITVPRMISVLLDTSTKLDKFTIRIATEISDDYIKKHATAPVIQPLTTDRNGAGWESPLTGDSWASADYLRRHGTFAEDASKYTHTIAMVDWDFGADDLENLGKDAFMLRGYIDQPALKTLPLYSRFVDTVKALSVPNNSAAKAARAWSDKAAKTWNEMKPLSCSDSPQTRTLLFDLGSHASTYAPE
jgi:Pentapeptide repeats (8 copies)